MLQSIIDEREENVKKSKQLLKVTEPQSLDDETLREFTQFLIAINRKLEAEEKKRQRAISRRGYIFTPSGLSG